MIFVQAKALAEKNERDMQTRMEQEERHVRHLNPYCVRFAQFCALLTKPYCKILCSACISSMLYNLGEIILHLNLVVVKVLVRAHHLIQSGEFHAVLYAYSS